MLDVFNFLIINLVFFASLAAFIILFSRVKKLEKKVKFLQNPDFDKELKTKVSEIRKNDSPIQEIIMERPLQPEKEPQKDIHSEIVFLKESNQEKNSFEKFFAGNVLNKVGAIALILGLGFFLKYAFDNNWLNAFAQVLICYLVSIGLIFAGNRIEKNSVFSQTLMGTGCAALYLTTYAGYSFYGIIPAGSAFILMSIVTILSILLAMNYDSRGIAFLGLFGAYITPFLMVASKNSVEILAYLIFLNILSAFTYYKKEWNGLESFSIFSNFITIYYLASIASFQNNSIVATALITLIWVIHFVIDILKNASSTHSGVNRILNSFFLYVLITNIIQNITQLGYIAILLSAACISTKLIKDFKGYKQNVILGLVFALIAVENLTDNFETMMGWIIISAIILLIGYIKEKSYLLNTSVSFLALSFSNLLFIKNSLFCIDISLYEPVFNPRFACFISIAIIGFVGSYFINKLNFKKGFAVNTLQFFAATAIFTLLSVEISDYSRLLFIHAERLQATQILAYTNLSYVVAWVLYSLVFIRKSTEIKLFNFFGYGAYALALFGLLGLAFTPIPSAVAIVNYRVIVWLIMIGATALIAKWNKNISTFFTYIALSLGFFLIYSEINIFLPVMSLKELILSLSWLIYAVILLSLGIWRNTKPFRYFAIGTISLVIFKIFLFDLTFLGQLHRIISFIGLGSILLLASYIYQRYAKYVI